MRPRRDYLSRPEEKSHNGRGNNPPSRHLWVGNLSHSLNESAVARQFAQFGDLESIAFQPGRSYAFINFRNEEDAFDAIRELQGFSLASNPLKIEFAKAEKSLMALHDEPYPNMRESPLAYDSRARHSSPERSHASKSKMSDKDNEEPSAVLWIGFPTQLKVDEFVLRRAFSPFGEIEKITSFPGRTYAFVRFRTVMSAYRAKETLQGKLLGNPRVRICFARSDAGPSGRDRDSRNGPPSPQHAPPYGRYGSYGNFHPDRSLDRFSGDHDTGSPPYIPDHDFHQRGMIKNPHLWPHESAEHDSRRFQGDFGLQRNVYEPPGSPRNMHSLIREYSPHYSRQHRPRYDDDPWDLPEEDVSLLHEPKKHKTNSFHAENELPEYPFADFEKEKHIIHPSGNTRHSGYTPVNEHVVSTHQVLREKSSHWNAVTSDDFTAASMPSSVLDRRRATPDLQGPSSKDVWKWEGLIAKGGTPVCHARCFPVGKPPEMALPEYIDCTARTSLDMLAKHYYQASSAWVVFFVPANDPDISYYNEFMNYLGENQRAAVAKLDERTTLFLVPPSEFSEKVLKVPGKLSIAGAVLRLDSPAGTIYGGSSFFQNEARDKSFASFDSDAGQPKPSSVPGPYHPPPPYSAYQRPGSTTTTQTSQNDQFLGTSQSVATVQSQNRIYSQDTNAYAENCPPHDPVATSAPLTSFGSSVQLYNPIPQPTQEASVVSYTPGATVAYGNSEFLATEQLAQLATLLGQQGPSNATAFGAGQQGNVGQLAPYNPFMPTDPLPGNNQSQFGQGQHLQQALNAVSSQREFQAGSQMNQQQFIPNSGQDEVDADPQKRLQATLQLAASLLQQIHQGKGN